MTSIQTRTHTFECVDTTRSRCKSILVDFGKCSRFTIVIIQEVKARRVRRLYIRQFCAVAKKYLMSFFLRVGDDPSQNCLKLNTPAESLMPFGNGIKKKVKAHRVVCAPLNYRAFLMWF